MTTERTAEVFSRSELAALLECEESTIDDWARRGELPALKLGRSWVFPREAVIERLNAIARAAKPVREERRLKRGAPPAAESP